MPSQAGLGQGGSEILALGKVGVVTGKHDMKNHVIRYISTLCRLGIPRIMIGDDRQFSSSVLAFVRQQ